MGTNSGSMHAKGWHPYHAMMAQSFENAAAKDKFKRAPVKAERSPVIWPGLPNALRWVGLNPTPWSRAEADRINTEQAALFTAKMANA